MALKLTADEQLILDQKRKKEEEDIRQELIKTQTLIAGLNNRIDAFARKYKSDDSNAQIMVWTQSISGSTAKLRSIAKSGLIYEEGVAKLIKLKDHIVDITWTKRGESLDTIKFKKLDRATYDALTKLFPKAGAGRLQAKVKISETKR